MMRFFDILIAILSLIILSPLLVVISVLILITNGRPIIFKQFRIGLKGKKFLIFKFRTMSNTIYKDENRRLTFFGKILRKTSLDELPQLINVLKKDMSVVGPRPLPKIIEKRIDRLSKAKRRKILPGITGMSQVNFTGKKRKMNKKIKLYIKFVDNYSMMTYFKILLKTPIIILIRLYKNNSSIIK